MPTPRMQLQSLTEIQRDSDTWRQKNFPAEHRTPELQLLGVMEELGELSHAYLKWKQGIRKGTGNFVSRGLMEDAVGDILIFLCGFCSEANLSMDYCLNSAWFEVQKRDWIKNKETGDVGGTRAIQEDDEGTEGDKGAA